MVHMRNRAYSPQMGRFMQPDPNATAMMLIEAASYHGRGLDAMVAAFDVQGMYGDGMSLYAYLGSNPWMRSDPLGLSWDPFSMVDEYLAEDAGNKAAFMSALGQGMKSVAVVAATIAAMMPFPIVNVAGSVALAVLNGEDIGSAMGASLALGLIPGGKLAAQAIGRIGGQIQASTFGFATQYATRHGARLAGGGGVNLVTRARAALSVAYRVAGPPTVVYIAYRGGLPGAGGKAVYVGITGRKLKTRLGEHNKPSNKQGPRNFDFLIPVTPPIPKTLAEAIETVLIMSNPHFENKAPGIGRGNSVFWPAVHAGTSWLQRNGVPFVY